MLGIVSGVSPSVEFRGETRARSYNGSAACRSANWGEGPMLGQDMELSPRF